MKLYLQHLSGGLFLLISTGGFPRWQKTRKPECVISSSSREVSSQQWEQKLESREWIQLSFHLDFFFFFYLFFISGCDTQPRAATRTQTRVPNLSHALKVVSSSRCCVSFSFVVTCSEISTKPDLKGVSHSLTCTCLSVTTTNPLFSYALRTP